MDTSIPSSSVIAPTDVVAAMFETYVEAVSARETLVAAGIDAGCIDIVDQAASVPAPAPGTWNMLRERLVPEHHAHGYAEGIDRGHALLFVRAAPAQQFRVMHLLEGLEPIDILSRTEEWKNTGWSGTHGSQSAEPPRMLFEDSPYPDHQRATGLINENDHVPPIGTLRNPMGLRVRTTGSDRVRRYELDGE